MVDWIEAKFNGTLYPYYYTNKKKTKIKNHTLIWSTVENTVEESLRTLHILWTTQSIHRDDCVHVLAGFYTI